MPETPDATQDVLDSGFTAKEEESLLMIVTQPILDKIRDETIEEINSEE